MSKKTSNRLIISLGIVISVSGLLVFAYLGYFNRFFADDWCYNQDFKALGIFGTLEGYLSQTRYASNRYSLTLFSGLMYPLGVLGVQFMTLAAIVVWCGGLYWLILNLSKPVHLIQNPWVRVLIAAFLLYFYLYLAPHPYQNLHWRAGFMPYTAPMISGTLLLGLYAYQVSSAKFRRWHTGLAFLLGFFAGGFSEAANTLLIMGTFLIILAVYVAKKKAAPKLSLLFPSALAGFLGTVFGLILLVSSPAIPLRMVSYTEPTSFIELPGLSVELGLDFMEYFIEGLPIPSAVILLLSFSTAILFFKGEKKQTFRRYIEKLIIVLAIAFLLICASQVPSAYIEHGPPEARGLFPSRVVFISALWAVGALTGLFIRTWATDRYIRLFAVISLLFCFVYVARSIVIVSERIPVYSERAAIWDDREAYIFAERSEGILIIDVRGIDSLPVGGMKDFKPDPKDWVNVCGAEYYDVDKIQAVKTSR